MISICNSLQQCHPRFDPETWDSEVWLFEITRGEDELVLLSSPIRVHLRLDAANSNDLT